MTKVKKVFDKKRANANDAYKERDYKWVAKKILKTQKKLGKIKSMNVKIESLSESRRDRLKQTGILVGATLASAAIASTAAGIFTAKAAADPTKKVPYTKGKPFSSLKAKGQATFSKQNLNNFKTGTTAVAKHVALPYAAGAAAGVALRNQVIEHNRRNVVIHVKYAYGERMFVVFQLKPKYEKQGIENVIFNNVKKEIVKLKERDEFPAKEDVQSPLEYKTLVLESMLLDTMLGED